MALIYNGSTNTFMDNHFATTKGYQLLPIPQRTILVVGGGELLCDSVPP
jgi:hypothetical protein